MLAATTLTKKRSDAEVAYSVLAKATFGAILYSFVFLYGAIQPLWYRESGQPPPMSPALAAVTAVLSAGLLLLPLVILFLLSFGYYGLLHKAMFGLTLEARESVWIARRWFRVFWILLGAAVIAFFGVVGASVLVAPEVVRLSTYLVFMLFPSALLIALVLFLGYAVWASLPHPRRVLLRRLIWADVLVVSGVAAGTAVLTALAWREIEASGVITPAYSPWTTIPSGAFNLATLVALYLAFRWVRRHPPLREEPIAEARPPVPQPEDLR